VNDADAPERALALKVYAVGAIDAVGLGLYLALSALFLNQAVGLVPTDVGIVLGVAGAASLLGALPIARAAQRRGLRAALVTLFVARAVAFVLLSMAGSFVGALVGAALTGVLSRGTAPLVNATLLVGRDRAAAVHVLARLRTVRNAGLALGGLPVGWVVWMASPLAYRGVIAASALMFLAAAALCLRLPDQPLQPAGAPRGPAPLLHDRPFLALTALHGALTLSAIVLAIGLPLWVLHASQAPAWTVGAIQVVNTAMVVVLQGWASRGTDVATMARGRLRLGGLVAAGATAIVAFGGLGGSVVDVAILVAALAGLTLAELWIVAGAQGVLVQYMPEHERPTYLAAFNLGFGAATVIGPPLVALGAAGPAWSWLAWGAFFAVVAGAVSLLPVPRPASAALVPSPAH
jgi:MFS family permease